jgi:hypothetical protein
MTAAWLLTWAFLTVSTHAQPPAEPEAPRTDFTTPVGKQLVWVLKCINDRAASDLDNRFTPRFLEQFTIAEVKDLLATLRDKAFKESEVSLISHEAQPRPDALSCIIGNDDAERYLSLILSVNEETGRIAGMTFSVGMSNRDKAEDRSGPGGNIDGRLGRVPRGLWFGAYEINIEHGGEAKADVRIRNVYEFGSEKRLNLATACRVYVLGTAGARVVQGTLTSQAVSLFDAGGWPAGTPVMKLVGPAASGDVAASDALLLTFGRDIVEQYLKAMQDGADSSLPFLTFKEWGIIKSPDHAELMKEFAAAPSPKRREMLLPEGSIGNLVGANMIKAPSPWTEPAEIETIGWFSTNREAGYAIAKLAMFEADPAVKAAGLDRLWRQEQRGAQGKPAPALLELDPKVWTDTMILGGSEPGVRSLLSLLRRADGRLFSLVICWNDGQAALDEAKLRELASKGLDILAREGRPPEAPAAHPQAPKGGEP